jgi:hypothetical protein
MPPIANLLVLLFGSAVLCLCRPRDTRWTHLFLVALLWVPAASLLCTSFLKVVSLSSEIRYDQYFALLEPYGGLSWPLGQLLRAHRLLMMVSIVDYGLVAPTAFGVFALIFASGRIREGYRVALCMFLNPILALIGYAVFPASGPRYAFPGWPYILPTGAPHSITLPWANNCLPSVHMSTALLVACFLWRSKAARPWLVLHLILTVLSTLGLGEHYTIDLVAAVPYTMFLVWLSGWLVAPRDRRKAEDRFTGNFPWAFIMRPFRLIGSRLTTVSALRQTGKD